MPAAGPNAPRPGTPELFTLDLNRGLIETTTIYVAAIETTTVVVLIVMPHRQDRYLFPAICNRCVKINDSVS
jgi:hypothetical protein